MASAQSTAQSPAISAAAPSVKERFLSLDFFRGLTMFLLIGESTLLYEHFRDPGLAGTLLHTIGTQLDHHPWAGLRFWDLVQRRGIFPPSKYAFRVRFSHFSLSLTSPSGRKYITHVVKQEDSSVGAGIRGVTEKGNSYL